MTGSVSLRQFRLPLNEPFRTSEGAIESRDGVAVRVETADEVGVGEATPLPGWTESLESTVDHLDGLRDHRGPVWDLPLPGETPAARHAIGLAVMDFAARAHRQPLAQYLRGPDHLTEVPVQATIGFDDTEDLREAIERVRASGVSAIKCKVGVAPIETDLERIEQLGPLGDDIEVRLDANQAWSAQEAKRMFQRAERVGVDVIEEPVREPTPAILSELSRGSVEMAIDETLAGREFVQLAEWWPVVDAVVIKPMVLGGLDRAITLANAARCHDVTPLLSNTVDGLVARSAAIHLAAALHIERPAGLATGMLLARDFPGPQLQVDDGRIAVPSGPGIGTMGPWGCSGGTR